MFDLTLINEAQALLEDMGYYHTKREVYELLLEDGIIDKDGDPTPFAIEAGLVKDAEEEENMSFEEFLDHYPIMKRFNPRHFMLIDGYWQADDVVLTQLEEMEKASALSAFDRYELNHFFNSREIIEEVE